jgi:hypothetical protein
MNLYRARFFSSSAAVTEMEMKFSSETQKTYANYQTSDLSFNSLLEAMEGLQRTEMTYQDYNDFYPLADELVHYFEQMLEGDIQVSASQVSRMINFGAQFGVGSQQYWEFCLEKLESKMKELDAPKAIKVINTLKDCGLLTQTLSFGLTDHLLGSKGLSAENLANVLLIA